MLKVALGRHWPQPDSQKIDLGASEWDGGSGFRCTITRSAPMKTQVYWKCFSSMEIDMTPQMKECSKCKEKKSGDSFYVDNLICKSCISAYQKAYRAKKNANKPADWKQKTKDKKAYQKAWNEANPGYSTRKKREWWQQNKDKLKVKWAVRDAILSGKLVRSPCFICGEVKVEGHHPDYSRPLDVVWLCTQHHRQLHKEHKHKLLSHAS